MHAPLSAVLAIADGGPSLRATLAPPGSSSMASALSVHTMHHRLTRLSLAAKLSPPHDETAAGGPASSSGKCPARKNMLTLWRRD